MIFKNIQKYVYVETFKCRKKKGTLFVSNFALTKNAIRTL